MKNRKITFYTELAYFAGIIILAFGNALIAKADFGVSMVVAPAYLIHLKLTGAGLTFFTFGTSSYLVQVVLLLIAVCVLKRFRLTYLFSFVTAVISGYVLDFAVWAVDGLPIDILPLRIGIFIIGMLCSTCGVAMLFNTYLSPEVYDMFVKELSAKYKIKLKYFKTAYDLSSLLLAIILSFSFYGMWHFEGVYFGTVICALLNGTLIANWAKLYNKVFDFKDKLPWRKYFTDVKELEL